MTVLALTEERKRRVAEALAGTPVLFAYLFGSQVTGRTDDESDADVGFYLDPRLSKKEQFDALLRAASRLDGLIPAPEGVDPVCLNDAPLLLQLVAISEGLLLYDRGLGARVPFEISVLQRHDDERRYRAEYRREFFRRLAMSSP